MIGPATAALCDLILDERAHPEQGFRACLGIIRLARSSTRPPRGRSTSARAPTARSNRSLPTTSIGVLQPSAPRMTRRSFIPTSAGRATTIRRSRLAHSSDP
jgi:hypothetical protein